MIRRIVRTLIATARSIWDPMENAPKATKGSQRKVKSTATKANYCRGGLMYQKNNKVMEWEPDRWPNFSLDEMRCKETGECQMNPLFMDRLQEMRFRYGKPIIITSGYRSPNHSIEARKATPGFHSRGRAVDIRCRGIECYELVKLAFECGFTGIGISQRQDQPRFIHIDDIGPTESRYRPTLYSY